MSGIEALSVGRYCMYVYIHVRIRGIHVLSLDLITLLCNATTAATKNSFFILATLSICSHSTCTINHTLRITMSGTTYIHAY